MTVNSKYILIMIVLAAGCVNENVNTQYVCPNGGIVSDSSECIDEIEIETTTTSLKNTESYVLDSSTDEDTLKLCINSFQKTEDLKVVCCDSSGCSEKIKEITADYYIYNDDILSQEGNISTVEGHLCIYRIVYTKDVGVGCVKPIGFELKILANTKNISN